MKYRLVIFFILIFGMRLNTQQVEKIIQDGNDLYRQHQYEQAEAKYRNATEMDPANKITQFNLANTLYKRNKPDEAKALYDEISNKEKEANDRSRSFYNKGVVLSAQKRLEESIEAYKYALRTNPDDKEARENLQKAFLELKKKNPPRKEEEKKQKEQKQQKSQSKMSPKEAEQKLKLLEQKEKETQQRLQKEKAKGGTSLPKDW